MKIAFFLQQNFVFSCIENYIPLIINALTMKKTFILLIFLPIFFSACFQESAEQPLKNPSPNPQIEQTARDMQGIYVSGLADLSATANHEIVLSLNAVTDRKFHASMNYEMGEESEAFAKKAFVLQRTATDTPFSYQLADQSVEMAIWDKGLVVYLPQQQVYLGLTLQGNEAAMDRIWKHFSQTAEQALSVYQGYGFGKFTQEIPVLSEYLADKVSFFDGNVVAGKMSECISGGPGATSCSYGNGGCSVSCAGDYYACCNNVTCTCEPG